VAAKEELGRKWEEEKHKVEKSAGDRCVLKVRHERILVKEQHRGWRSGSSGRAPA
jgi:hypothetical protein